MHAIADESADDDVEREWPEPGTVVTFGMYDWRLGSPQFVGIGVVSGEPQPHPHGPGWRLPLLPLDDDAPATPDWIRLTDIIEIIPTS